ncbi:uncharacterized protein LOC121855579 [Homarus americanus]|uniref:Uncharacterized protein n=1 Tax=Homarus americanus TaxID=6706 RepID=A0A8J5JC41_HOMAM|nr:uncharacterized protein LOC121855579 [Homarus americanus]KAG7155086.1 hypothetical protein Hamer_G015693 [Homarus americanus]
MSEQVVREIFNKLDKTSTLAVKRHVKVVETFLSKLQAMVARSKGQLRGSRLLFSGAHHESLAVATFSDFEVELMLGLPYSSDNFTIYFDTNSELYALGWRKHKKIDFADKEDFLKTQRLQNKIFSELRALVDTLVIPGAKIQAKETPNDLSVTITIKNEATRVHLTPLIAGRSWEDCSRLTSLQELPETVRQSVEDLRNSSGPLMFFSLAVPQRKTWDDGHRLTDVSFTFLENDIIRNNAELRDMVRLLKLVADRSSWHTKYSLQPSHLHRLTIKYADQLKEKTTWEGYSTLLTFLYSELGDWKLDSLFVKGRLTISTTCPLRPMDFQDELAVVMDYRPCKVRSLV